MNKINKIFITGASGGIGSAICDKFNEKNFSLKKIWKRSFLL